MINENIFDYEFTTSEILYEMALNECNSMFMMEASNDSDNVEAPKSVIDSFLNMLKTLINQIKKVVLDVKDKIDRKLLDAESKRKLAEFENALKQYPELKNVKVKVSDFKKIAAEYKDFNEFLEKTYKDEIIDEPSTKEKIEIRFKAFKKVASEAVTTVTLDTMYREALNDRDLAKAMYNNLISSQKAMDELYDKYGEKGATIYLKKLKKATHLVSLNRFKMKLFRTYNDSITDNFSKSLSSFAGAMLGKTKGSVGNVAINTATDVLKGMAQGNKVDSKDILKNIGKNTGTEVTRSANTKMNKDLVDNNEYLSGIRDANVYKSNIAGKAAKGGVKSFGKEFISSSVKNKIHGRKNKRNKPVKTESAVDIIFS